MKLESKSRVKNEIIMFLSLTIASAIIAFNLKSFVRTGGLFPGGFSGLALLVQQILSEFFNVTVPYSAIYMPVNLIPAYIGFKYIGKRFTIYSFYLVFLSSFLTDVFPAVTITYDILLISIFGGIIQGAAISIALISGASGGGTDFIAIYFSEEKRGGCMELRAAGKCDYFDDCGNPVRNLTKLCTRLFSSTRQHKSYPLCLSDTRRIPCS